MRMAINPGGRRPRDRANGRNSTTTNVPVQAPAADASSGITMPRSSFQRVILVWFAIVGVVSLLALNEYQKLGLRSQQLVSSSGLESRAGPIANEVGRNGNARRGSSSDADDESLEVYVSDGERVRHNLRESDSDNEERHNDEPSEPVAKELEQESTPVEGGSAKQLAEVSSLQQGDGTSNERDLARKMELDRKRMESHSKNLEDEEDDEEFEIPFDIRPVYRYGCPFGWHSPSRESSNCYHVSLVTLTSDEANGRCAELGSVYGMRAYLARVTSTEVNMLLCDVLNRGNNRFLSPDRLHIGLERGVSTSNSSIQWRDGTPYNPDEEFGPFVSSASAASTSSTQATTLLCSGKQYLKWNVEPDSAQPFACSGPKLKTIYNGLGDPEDRRELDEDSFTYERSSIETISWAPVAPWERHSVSACKKLAQEEEEFGVQKRMHKNPILAALETQITWKLTDKKSKIEPKRHYLVWHSKSWFGWLDFWVEYLVKYRDFHGAPVGKYVTSSRAAKQRLGYSSIFGNPAVVQKYEGALVVLSRLPIPENVLAYFPPGTLVNQIYYDPVSRVPLGDKLELAQQMVRYAEQLECNEVADLEIIPQTFDLSTSQGCAKAQRFMGREQDQTEISWIIKGPKHGGAAITLASSEQVLSRIHGCGEIVLGRHEIVQRLVKNPLLLDGRKFDLRVFVLVASTKPLIVYVHREPYYRATIRKFQSGGSSSAASEKSRHVTNTHIQKVARSNFTERDWADHLWTPDKVKLYASKAGVQPDFWQEIVFPKIKRAVQTVIKATASTLKERRPAQWKLFGVDFIIDDTLNPLLLDWNAFPGWDWSYRLSWTLDYRRRILGDTWRLMLDIQRGKAIAESRDTPMSGGYELVFHSLK